MLVVPDGSAFGAGGKMETNITVSSAGTSVAAHTTANAKGTTWTTLISSTVGPSYGVFVRVQNVHVSATIANYLLDIGIGAAGSEILVLPDLGCGAAAQHTTAVGGKEFFFPIYIPAGVRVSARAAANLASDTALVQIWLVKKPLYPILCGRVSAYGVDLAGGSRGTSITPGNGAFGTWTLLKAGPMDRPHTLWYCAMDGLSDTTMIDNRHFTIELGVGPDNANVSTLFRGHGVEEGSEAMDCIIPVMPQYGPTIADSAADLWCRIAEQGATEARGIIAYGMD